MKQKAMILFLMLSIGLFHEVTESRIGLNRET